MQESQTVKEAKSVIDIFANSEGDKEAIAKLKLAGYSENEAHELLALTSELLYFINAHQQSKED